MKTVDEKFKELFSILLAIETPLLIQPCAEFLETVSCKNLDLDVRRLTLKFVGRIISASCECHKFFKRTSYNSGISPLNLSSFLSEDTY